MHLLLPSALLAAYCCTWKKATYEQEDVAQYCRYNVLVTQKTQAASKENVFSLNADKIYILNLELGVGEAPPTFRSEILTSGAVSDGGLGCDRAGFFQTK